MDHGNKTNIEIHAIITSGIVSYNDTVFSTDWNETLVYNGVVFISKCSCNYIGEYPICEDVNIEDPIYGCPMVKEAYASFIS